MRQFFETCLLLVVLLMYCVAYGEACTECQALHGGEAFKDCRPTNASIYRREGNVVYANLVVDVADIEIEWLKIKRRVYNNDLCGPTIRMKAGDTVYINLENRLGPEQAEGVHNELRHPNTTNIHTHGLHISSLPPGDDVFTRVDPGESHNFTYEVNIEQPAGTYWYHAHWHGSTFLQVMSGLTGLLIVEDDPAEMSIELDAVSCPNHCEHDVEILLQSTLQYTNNSVDFIHEAQEPVNDSLRLDKSTEEWLRNVDNGFDYFTTNGLYNPILTIPQNQMKRFRVANGGGYVGLEVEVARVDNGDGKCEIKEIAFDGVYLDAPRNQIYNQTYITTGARADWLIYCDTPGIYQLRSMALPDGEWSVGTFRRYNGTFLTINVAESHLGVPTFPAVLPTRPEFIQDLRDVGNISEENKFTVEFSDNFFMNRQKFEKGHYGHRMEVGSIQEWTFVNSIRISPHPLHIHVNHFQVMSYNDYIGPLSGRSQHYFDEYPTFVLRSQSGQLCNDTYGIPSLQYEDPNLVWPDHPDEKFVDHRERWEALEQGVETGKSVGYARRGDWRDVLNVPPHSNITVRFNAHQYDGPVIIHCHVLKHEDLGMMMTVDVVKDITKSSYVTKRDLGCQEVAGEPEPTSSDGLLITVIVLSVVCLTLIISCFVLICRNKN